MQPLTRLLAVHHVVLTPEVLSLAFITPESLMASWWPRGRSGAQHMLLACMNEFNLVTFINMDPQVPSSICNAPEPRHLSETPTPCR